MQSHRSPPIPRCCDTSTPAAHPAAARSFALLSLLLLLGLAWATGAQAHHAPSHRILLPDAPAAHAPLETFRGQVDELVVEDRALGLIGRYFALRLGDGRHLALRNAAPGALVDGATVAVSGRLNRDHLFVDSVAPVTLPAMPPRLASKAVTTVEGRLEFLHADDFEKGTCDLVLSVIADDGSHTPLKLATWADALERGMRVRVSGTRLQAGPELTAMRVEILAPAQPDAAPQFSQDAVRSSKVIVILIKYSDTTAEPFTQAQVDSTVFSGASSVANYYRESSFQNHVLTGVTTPWLVARFPKPATCDYSAVATEAAYLANQAGYQTSTYEKQVYVFPTLPGCGWAGLGGGSQAWINQSLSLLVVGHELGHTFGLGHASSVDCGAVTVGGTCTKSEYGDPFEIMGNQRAMHFNAAHKDDLGYLPAGTVRTHKRGVMTYTLQPLQTAGAQIYAVKVEAGATRQYWIEYRQATGFDAGLAGNANVLNGALVHLGYPNDYSCDTCIVDMTPATSAFTDAALTVGNTFVDDDTGAAIGVLAKTAAGLDIAVAMPPTVSQFGLYRPSNTRFLLDYNFDHTPNVKPPFGATGDVPVVGRFTSSGRHGIAAFRNGFWYVDNNRDGVVDATYVFGGAGDIPLTGSIAYSGQDDLVVYRNGVWYVDYYYSRNGVPDRTFRFGGAPGDKPLLADLNGDGFGDLIIYRNGVWYADTNRDGVADAVYYFGGAPADIPVAFDWDGDGKADLGIYRDGTWYISTVRDGSVQASFIYGAAGDIPLPGRFN